jgi:hypothetical protein
MLRIPLASKVTSISGTPRGCSRNARKLELAEKVVVLRAGTLTLVEPDKRTGLFFGVRREDLRLLGTHSSVALDEYGNGDNEEHERQWRALEMLSVL